MADYYNEKLSAERLKRVYEVATPRVQQYLRAEIDYVVSKVREGDIVVELGCGYGRLLPALAERAGSVFGIDTSLGSLTLAREMLPDNSRYHLACMNAVRLGFRDEAFDVVVCVQNGISAFHENQQDLVRECVRVCKKGGTALFSSYSDKFWDHRLEWFELQSQAGLLGQIDYKRTGNGEIVCTDGFTATTVRPDRFRSLTSNLGVDARIVEVDESSLFCEVVVQL
jgi:2-polyprenyl-6-hydroxyphenyl methylase/3-demethylubiquinone-9 3-methyltransferase